MNAKTGKIERVFVNLEAVYPNPSDPKEELCFEELRARHRGWLDKDWTALRKSSLNGELELGERHSLGLMANSQEEAAEISEPIDSLPVEDTEHAVTRDDADRESQNAKEGSCETRNGRSKKIRVMEVKVETQTGEGNVPSSWSNYADNASVKTNLESPTGPKLRRKTSAEPTMTINTRAATDDILDIFNQPLRNMGCVTSLTENVGESDYDDDDYTSAGESTGTGRISGTSEFGDETTQKSVVERDETNIKSVSSWSEFTARKHIPRVGNNGGEDDEEGNALGESFVVLKDYSESNCEGEAPKGAQEDEDVEPEELVTPVSPERHDGVSRTRFIPIPPEDCELPIRAYRDPFDVAQNRLPFMTPIVERTESSIGATTARGEKDYFNSKTPSRQKGDGTPIIPEVDEKIPSSPFQEIVIETKQPTPNNRILSTIKPSTANSRGPIIPDSQCNPMDKDIRQTILDNVQPPFSSYPSFHNHGTQTINKAPEICKFVKAIAKTSKSPSERTATSLSMPPTLRFPASTETYTLKRELGKGAFAPVYLAEMTLPGDDNEDEPASACLVAIKSESPPSPWEYYIMATASFRLSSSCSPLQTRAASSLATAFSMHLFADEGYLLEEYRDQGTLLDFVNVTKMDHANGNMDESIAMFFTIELLRTIEALHAIGILHGDIKADNCLVRLPFTANPTSDEWTPKYQPDGIDGWADRGLTLIDFGRGTDLRAFRDDVGFIADWKTGKHDCPEMRDCRPWRVQADWWGVASTVHVLLWGKYLEDICVSDEALGKEDGGEMGLRMVGKRYRPKDQLKRYWQTELWGALFEVCLNSGKHDVENAERGGVAEKIRGIREAMEEWLEANSERLGLRGKLNLVGEKLGRGRR